MSISLSAGHLSEPESQAQHEQDLHISEASVPSVLGLGFGLDTRAPKRTHSEVGESCISPVAAPHVFDCDMDAACPY